MDRAIKPCMQHSTRCSELVVCHLASQEPLGWKNVVAVLNDTKTADELHEMKSVGVWSVHWFSSMWYNKNDVPGLRVTDPVNKCLKQESLFHKILQHSCPRFLTEYESDVVCSIAE
jgi:hypothetical protein